MSIVFLRRYAIFVFVWVFLVIIAGGVVRTTQSGMGCPDWPKCFGMWVPPTSVDQLPLDYEKYLRKQDIDHTFNAYHTWIEYINRLLGALLGLIAIVQVVLFLPYRRSQPRIFFRAAFFLGIVIITGLVGAIVVKLNLAHLSISVHLLLAFLILQVQLLLLLALQNKEPVLLTPKIKAWVLVFLISVIVQSTMGTAVRMYIDDISKSLNYTQRDTWLQNSPAIFLVHRTFSWAVLGLLLYGLIQFRNSVVNKVIWWLGFFTIINISTGIILYYSGMPALGQPIHLTLAAAIITQCCYILFRSQKKSMAF